MMVMMVMMMMMMMMMMMINVDDDDDDDDDDQCWLMLLSLNYINIVMNIGAHRGHSAICRIYSWFYSVNIPLTSGWYYL